jgi:DNA-binding LytR/AlgR family response regulator
VTKSFKASLRGKRLLIVEDEYLIASELARELSDLGAEIVGPAATVAAALNLVEQNGNLDAAVLDINLRNERVYAVADALIERAVPFVFTTGYDASAIEADYETVPRCEKPVDAHELANALAQPLGYGVDRGN